MEIEGEDGSEFSIKPNSKKEFGRGLGFPPDDRTVSRHHILFQLRKSPNSGTRVQFEVLGKNPVWVFSSENGDTRVFKNSDKGEMSVGDSFCVSSKNPILFKLRKSEVEEEKGVLEGIEKRERLSADEEMAECIRSGVEEKELDEELGFEYVDILDIDPVQEFGFVVMGHEFDHYPKTKICAIKDWNWFLEKPTVDSDTDEDTERKKSKSKGVRRKKKDEGIDDEEWTGESEDEKEVISKVRNSKRPKYTTRSKDVNKPLRDVGSSKSSEHKKNVSDIEDEEDEVTLGGFIVDEEELEEEGKDDEEEAEEEDFEDEEDEL